MQLTSTFHLRKGKLAMSKRMIRIVVTAIMMSLVLMSNVAAESAGLVLNPTVNQTKSSSNDTRETISYRPLNQTSPYHTLNRTNPYYTLNCSKLAWNLANCSSFLSRGSTTKEPETSCCSGVKIVNENNPRCFCEAFNHSNFDLNRTLSLPAACNVSASSFSNCIALAISIASAPIVALFPPAAAPNGYHNYEQNSPYHYEQNSSEALAIGLSIAATTTVMLLVVGVCYYRIKKSSNKQKEKPKDKQSHDSIIKEQGFLAPKRYSYSQIRKMTNSFRDKLGEGGFGEVYKGTLIDGDGCRPVAVKILKANKADGEDFINEVLNISRTSHVNVVTLLGFCIDGKKRALVFEFMANGSLERYIYKERMSKSCTGHLGWERLYQIAIGVARGLEYLHRGCNTRILHFDIKPHNILLDEDFCPKISDFGLAKQCKKKESIISMIETRGTIGYIAPEVISRNFGGVSHKSDVYSYGMMLLEMVGGRKNICPLVSQTSEIYFPQWAYQRMAVGRDLKLQSATTEEENEIAKKMIIVGLWCIQNDPMQRPAMKKVIEMLEGSLESMEIPPKPFFGSPSRSEADSSDTAEEIISIS